MASNHWITLAFAAQPFDETWPLGYAVAGREPRSQNETALGLNTEHKARECRDKPAWN
jgi:hypothetical protein